MLKSTSAISMPPFETRSKAASPLAASESSTSGRMRRNALVITMRASLLSSTMRTLCVMLADRLETEMQPQLERGGLVCMQLIIQEKKSAEPEKSFEADGTKPRLRQPL